MEKNISSTPARPSLLKRLKWLSIAVSVAPLIHKSWRQVYETIRALETPENDK